jgi:phage replication-related protein YjqB (UPF0714/DUF867 family)
MNLRLLKMLEIVSSITHNLVKTLINKYLCKLLSIVLATTLFTFVGSIGWTGYALADHFGCYENCSKPLKNSDTCIQGKDYSITSNSKRDKNVIVLSIHGGLIETHTSEITRDLSRRYKWGRYDFSGQIKNKKCAVLAKDNSTNIHYNVLHITSTEFNDPIAIALVESHKKAVSIHGYKRKERSKVHTICVGGQNEDQINKFIKSVNKESSELKDRFDYSLNLVDVPKAHKSGVITQNNVICLKNDENDDDPLTGIDPENIVNRTTDGGLQIELNERIRNDLAEGINNPGSSSLDKYQVLRNVIFNAIKEAMND